MATQPKNVATGRKDLREELERFIVPFLEETGVLLGKGVYGEVLEMRMKGELVAVKKVHKRFQSVRSWEANFSRFKEDCVRLSEISHTNIVSFHGLYFEGDSNVPMLVMEYLPQSLRLCVEESIPPYSMRTSILIDVARGLNYLHGLDPPLIHCNLTSNNVLLMDNFHAKISDLGVSRLLTNHVSLNPRIYSHVAPEVQLMDRTAFIQPTKRATKLDVFSFGNVMINVLTGEFPVATSERDKNGKHRTEVERRTDLLVKIQESKEKDLIIRCLDNNPDHRPTADELVHYFEGNLSLDEEHETSLNKKENEEHETSSNKKENEEHETSSNKKENEEHETSSNKKENEEHETSSNKKENEEHETSSNKKENEEHETSSNKKENEEHETSSNKKENEKHETSSNKKENEEHETSSNKKENEEHETSSNKKENEEHETSSNKKENEEHETSSNKKENEEHETSSNKKENEEHETSSNKKENETLFVDKPHYDMKYLVYFEILEEETSINNGQVSTPAKASDPNTGSCTDESTPPKVSDPNTGSCTDESTPPKVSDPNTSSLYPCFTVSDFTERKTSKSIYYSDPFYSHGDGYKMQLCVYAAKDGDVGLFIQLMNGPNDDHLQWPFYGNVALELVNWRSDKHHHTKVLSVGDQDKRNRIMKSNLTGNSSAQTKGWMMTANSSYFLLCNEDLISHSTLPFNAATGTEYLKDNCLRFRVKEVVVHSTPTLHKEPSWQTRQSIEPPPQFTVNNFSKRKSLSSGCLGPTFYTHGYKMQLRVEPCEDGHVGLYVSLLNGGNDASLDWPLYANVVVELLNWRQDSNHHSYNIAFHERIPLASNSHVEFGESKSWGIANFIPYHLLSFNDTEYLQDDCLCVRVRKVATYSTKLSTKAPRWQMYNEPASFTITNVAERKEMDNFYFSPPFHAAKYKMCLKIYVGGSGGENCGYVSMYACLLKGKKDGSLEWPFCGDLTIEVLNWCEDRDHYKNVLPLDCSTSEGHSRVTTEVIEPVGYGLGKFMPTSTLFSKYLKDNCMRVRVTDIVMYNTPLRFKTPSWKNWWNKVDFTVTGVSSRLANKTTCYSPPFYTHSKGYKLRLEVEMGDSEGEMGIYARLMAGEYDSLLKWPMNVEVTVEMVNWVRDRSHVLNVIRFGEASLDARRRVPDQTAPTAWGYPRFCTHAKMFGVSHRVQYIQEDCVHIQVREVSALSRN